MISVRAATLALTALLLAPLAAQAAEVDQYWNVAWVPDLNLDGLYTRRVIGVNGSWPPPIINVNSTDVVRIHVNNDFGDGTPTTLHSHGMFFNNTGWSDGATYVTQCPIPDGSTYTYEIINSPSSPNGTELQSGTYWCHGHLAGQYVDGLKTANIIHPETEAHAYDEDYTVVLTDWYHDEYAVQMKSFLSTTNPTGAEPIPDSALMYFAHTPNVAGGASWLPGFNDNTSIPVTPGKTYRLRIINMSSLAMFHFWIDGHQMRIIEADGVDTQEYPIDEVVVSVAQRYSVLVTANDDASENFKIHANMDPEMFDTVPDTLQLNITSTFEYSTDANTPVAEEETRDYAMFDDTVLVPFYPSNAPPADTFKDMNVWFDTRSNGENYAAFNNISFIFPQTPSINTLLSMGDVALYPQVYGPSTNAFVYNHMDIIEVTIFNWDAGFHPFHLHGHQFWMVHKALVTDSADAMENPPYDPTAVATNPMRRDTVMVPAGGSATIRFVADNPGQWLFHCHIQPHLSSGLAAIFVEAPSVAQSRLTLPSYATDACNAMGISTTGNAGGLNSTTDFGSLAVEVPPLVTGWTPAAVGSVVGCAITAALGLLTVLIYGLGGESGKEEEEEEEDK